MTRRASQSRLLAKIPSGISSPASEIHSDRLRPFRRRRRRFPLFISTDSGGERGKRSIPVTPLLKWKFEEEGEPRPGPGEEALRKHNKPAASARRLAAEIWHLQLPKVVGGCETTLDFEFLSWDQGADSMQQRPHKTLSDVTMSMDYLGINGGQLHLPYVSNVSCFNLRTDTNEDLNSLRALKNRSNGKSQKLEASASLLLSSTERATNWDLGYPKASKDAFDLYDNLKLHEDQKPKKFSIVSALRSELAMARSKIREFEAERQYTKKKLDHFMKRIEEKAAWRRREHEKIKSVIDVMQEHLNREKKNAQRLEIMNTNLVHELAEAKLSAKKLLLEYEKERKARALVEEVCNELAKEIGDDKAEFEELKMESAKTREEVEEERKMLQIAEVWREERVQMKLIDAKLALEEKYSKLSQLQKDIEAFLSLASCNNYDSSETKQGKMLKEAVGSVIARDMKDFSYHPPPASDAIFSIFEELQPRQQGNIEEIEQCHEANGFSQNPIKRYNNMIFYRNCDAEEDDSGWETASHVEEHDSCKSPDGSEPSVTGLYLESQASVSGVDCDMNRDDERQNSEISEVCSTTRRQSRKKGSSLSRLWKSSRASNAGDFEKTSFEIANEMLCNGGSFDATLSSARKSVEAGLGSPGGGSWSSRDLLNPHMANGIEGRVEWPRHTKQQSLKAKLKDARIQSQKVQLRQVLKQKI